MAGGRRRNWQRIASSGFSRFYLIAFLVAPMGLAYVLVRWSSRDFDPWDLLAAAIYLFVTVVTFAWLLRWERPRPRR